MGAGGTGTRMMPVVPSRSVEDPSVCFKQALRGWRRTIDPGCAAGRAVNGIRSGRSFAMSSGIASPCVIRDRPRALHVGGAGIVCVGPLGRPAASAGSRRAASASLRGSSVACLRAAGLIRWSNVKMRAKRPHGRAGESGGTRNREGCTATRLDPARWIYWRQRSATSRSWLCPSDRVANCRPSRPGTLCLRPTQRPQTWSPRAGHLADRARTASTACMAAAGRSTLGLGGSIMVPRTIAATVIARTGVAQAPIAVARSSCPAARRDPRCAPTSPTAEPPPTSYSANCAGTGGAHAAGRDSSAAPLGGPSSRRERIPGPAGAAPSAPGSAADPGEEPGARGLAP
jgi:hypothetical protein